MSKTSRKHLAIEEIPSADQFVDAIHHVDDDFSGSDLLQSTPKGLIYSLLETLGSIAGDPDLPSHLRSGYEGAIELARDVEARIE
ncbi:hypothetical protein [Polynucleobacter sp. MWH-UH23A]|uniref:hypothetical protein n=1 Tax=Polynucleobacter sp. MWH-UH23A TaxID=1855613 RepID=UPI0033650EF5